VGKKILDIVGGRNLFKEGGEAALVISSSISYSTIKRERV
jgi:hypothetical protein